MVGTSNLVQGSQSCVSKHAMSCDEWSVGGGVTGRQATQCGRDSIMC